MTEVNLQSIDALQIGLTLFLVAGLVELRVKFTKLRVCFDEHMKDKNK